MHPGALRVASSRGRKDMIVKSIKAQTSALTKRPCMEVLDRSSCS